MCKGVGPFFLSINVRSFCLFVCLFFQKDYTKVDKRGEGYVSYRKPGLRASPAFASLWLSEVGGILRVAAKAGARTGCFVLTPFLRWQN